MHEYRVRVRVTRVHEHVIIARDETAAGELAVELGDEDSERDSFDSAELLDVTMTKHGADR